MCFACGERLVVLFKLTNTPSSSSSSSSFSSSSRRRCSKHSSNGRRPRRPSSSRRFYYVRPCNVMLWRFIIGILFAYGHCWYDTRARKYRLKVVFFFFFRVRVWYYYYNPLRVIEIKMRFITSNVVISNEERAFENQ